MGVDVRTDKDWPNYRFPPAWGYADRRHAAQWAAAETDPRGYTRGGPVPSLDAVAAELLAMPLAPPKTLTAREEEAAAWTAAAMLSGCSTP